MYKLKAIYSLLASMIILPAIVACGDDAPKYVPVPEDPDDPGVVVDTTSEPTSKLYSWESLRSAIPSNTDMVLLYGGSHHRPTYQWDETRLQPYVTYVDEDKQEHWLFDSFLFIEFVYYNDGVTKALASGYNGNSATRSDWAAILDYLFDDNYALSALDNTIENSKARLGEPKQKHQVVLSLFEPIAHLTWNQSGTSSTYWGKYNGVSLSFSNDADRVTAVKWYINEARKRFNAKKFKNIELAGFYWVPETSSNTSTILKQISDYLHTFKYSFNWIPYFEANGYASWQNYGYDFAYMQPNYFFSESVMYDRFAKTYTHIYENNMDMEIEFDEDAAYASNPGTYRGDRLRDYMTASRELGVWENKRLAYYHGNDGLLKLYKSDIAADQELYHEFCNFVISRPIRKI